MTTARCKSIAYVTAIFIAGGVTGASIAYMVARPRMDRPMRPHDMELRERTRLHDGLGLTPDQAQKVDPLLAKGFADIRTIHMETMQRIGKVIDATHVQIAALLTPEQKRKLDEMERQRRIRMRDQPGSWRHHGYPGNDGRPGPGGPNGLKRSGRPDEQPGALPPPAPPPAPDR